MSQSRRICGRWIVKSLPIDAFEGSRYRRDTDNYFVPSNLSLTAVSRGKRTEKEGSVKIQFCRCRWHAQLILFPSSRYPYPLALLRCRTSDVALMIRKQETISKDGGFIDPMNTNKSE